MPVCAVIYNNITTWHSSSANIGEIIANDQYIFAAFK